MYGYIDCLIQYGRNNQLINERDIIYIRNQLLSLLHLPYYESADTPEGLSLCEILDCLTSYACEKGLITDTAGNRELFQTKLMGVLTPLPSVVIDEFQKQWTSSPAQATDYFFDLCSKVNYIQDSSSNIIWKASTEYGALDITINLSKPEKDPRDIAAAQNTQTGEYPHCLLCMENEGYAGRTDHPARQNLRIIPIEVNGEPWGLQYSPYQYYREHCIVLNQKHVPMVIDDTVFRKLFSFLEAFPHYFVGSNADLPIVGGSILSHEHFQGGNYEFPMAKAPVETYFEVKGFEQVKAGIVRWPMSTIRLAHCDKAMLAGAASQIMRKWYGYTDEDAFIFAETDGVRHNTLTPVARKRGESFELDLVLRNNVTTTEHPLGVFHPHEEVQNIKKENIGLIEVMGLAILPARLREEMYLLEQAILAGKDIRQIPDIQKHAAWWEDRSRKYQDIPKDKVREVLQQEIGLTFLEILHHAGVFKRDEKGREAFLKFARG